MARTDIKPLSQRSGERRIGDIPPEWNKAQRKQERGKARNEMNRIRSGAVDWDNVPLRSGNSYRRDYYW